MPRPKATSRIYWRQTLVPFPDAIQDWVADQGPRVWSGHATWDEVLTAALTSAGIPVPPVPETQLTLFGEETP